MKKYTTEELLSALETPDEHVEASEVLRFLHKFNITEGSNKIRRKSLFLLYSRTTDTPLKPTTFAFKMEQFVPGNTKFYYINLDPKKVEMLTENNKPKTQDKTKSLHYRNHFESFINKLGLVNGQFGLKAEVIHDLYDQWHFEQFNKKSNKFSPYIFNEFIKLYFKTKKDNTALYAMVDPRILDKLTYEQKLRCLSSKGQQNVLKKEKQKKSN